MNILAISRSVFWGLLSLLLGEATLHAESYVWVGGSSGNWENSANWISASTPQHGGIPGHGDYATIDPATDQQGQPLLTTVTISSAVSTGLSSIGGDTTLLIAGSGSLMLETPAFTYADGDVFYLIGSIANYGRLNIPGLLFYTFNAQLYGYTNLGSITNYGTGVIDIQAETSMIPYWNYGVGYNYTIHNYGTIRESGGQGARFDAYLDNHGTVQSQSGTLRWNSGSNLGGTFQADADAAIEFSGGTITLSSPPTNFNGPGTVRITTAEVLLNNLTGTLDLFGSKVSGTIANGGALNLRGGDVNADTSLVLASGAVLNLTDEGWGHSSNYLNWGLGLAGTLSVQAGATVNQNTTLFISGTLTNAGNYNWLDGDIEAYGPGASITNAAGGLFDIRCDNQLAPLFYYNGYTSTFQNAGTLRKSAGGGVNNFFDYLDNTGTVQVQSGGIKFARGSNLGGAFQADAGTGIAFNGGTFTLSAPPSNFFGPGSVSITTAEVLLNNLTGTLDLFGSKVSGTIANGGALNLRGGDVNADTSLVLASGAVLNLTDEGWGHSSNYLNWGLGLAGTLSVQAGATVNQNTTLFISGTLTNAGNYNWLDGDIDAAGPGASITNAAGGLFDIRCDNQLTPLFYYNGYTSTFHNAGTLRKSAGGGVNNFSDYLDNTGTVQVQSGGLNFTGGTNLGGTFQADAGTGIAFNGGTFTLSAPPSNFFGPGSVSITTAEVVLDNFVGTQDLYGSNVRGSLANGGVLNLHGGSVNVDTSLVVGSGAILNLTDSIGLSGTLSVLAGGTVNQNAPLSIYGTLTNAGTYNWLDGEIFPGGPDTLFTNAPGGLFDIRCDNQLAPWNYYNGNTSTFHNAGTLRKSAGDGTTYFFDYLDNTGTVQALSGMLDLHGDAALSAGRIECRVAGPAQYGTVELNSTSPAGELLVTLVGAYHPSGGETFQLIQHDGPGAGFSAVSFPGVAQWQLVTSQTNTGIFIPLSAIQNWRQTYFGTTANSEDAADTADPDGDGISNMVEFAFGLNPLVASGSAKIPQPQRISGNYVSSFTEPSGIAGITYGAEWSPTMAPGSWLLISDTGSGGVHTFSVPIGSNTKMFMRLKTSIP